VVHFWVEMVVHFSVVIYTKSLRALRRKKKKKKKKKEGREGGVWHQEQIKHKRH
jgi:hypothetical protein